MKKEKRKRDLIAYIAFISLLISVLSVFTTIIGYTNGVGEHRNFSLIDFISSDGGGFETFVAAEYTSTIYMEVDMVWIHVLLILGIAAVICAFVGVFLISRQKTNRLSFILTLFGLIGTMAPSICILIFVLVVKDNYLGTITCGLYPIISPISMIICIITTTKMYRKDKKYKKMIAEAEAEGLIHMGGDL